MMEGGSSKMLVSALVALAVGVVVGGIIGHYSTPTITYQDKDIIRKYKSLTTDQWLQGEADNTNAWILDQISTDNLADNLEFLAAEPHLAATARDEELAEHIRQRFQDAGFDWAEMMPQRVLLSRPDKDRPNKVFIKDAAGQTNFTSRHQEDFGDKNVTDFVDAFNAFTPAGEAESVPGEAVVYVNYGRVEDFDQLEELNVNMTGRIALMRYGAIFRGNKIDNAAKYKAIGAILFSDPDDVAKEGQSTDEVFPNTWWLPDTGMQRGSAFLGNGDPLTPGWPSTEHAYRIDKADAGLLKIPGQPIGYADASQILEKLGGVEAPDDWQGGLSLISGKYKVGPAFLSPFAGYTVRLETHNIEEELLSYNVLGTITGAVEPDRYVLIGNHRDAWGYGASDPSSGTSQLLETARVLGELKKRGWRPRRTLVFCSWGAEEYGLIGSTEWVEEHVDKLQGRAVAYVNTDTCSTGPVLEVPASPLLWDMIKHVAKQVPGVRDSSDTVYDEMVAYHEQHYPAAAEKPVMKTLGSGSDYAHFFMYAGVPAIDIWFRSERAIYNISIYPSYHTGFETFEMVSKFNDPGFRYTQGCGRVASLTLKYLADSLVLPFNLTSFPVAMQDSLDGFRESGVRDTIMDFYEDYVYLEEAVSNLTAATATFHQALQGQQFDPVQLRAVNDQMMKFEQTFLIPGGLPNRPFTRHAVFAPSQFDNYASAGFPGIADLLHEYAGLTDEQERLAHQRLIMQHVSLLTIMTNRAAGLVTDVHRFD